MKFKFKAIGPRKARSNKLPEARRSTMNDALRNSRAELEFDDDLKHAFDRMVEMERNPTRWFCVGFVEVAIPRVFARGETEDAVVVGAREAAICYIKQKRGYREVPPLSEWIFVTYPPTPWSSSPL